MVQNDVRVFVKQHKRFGQRQLNCHLVQSSVTEEFAEIWKLRWLMQVSSDQRQMHGLLPASGIPSWFFDPRQRNLGSPDISITAIWATKNDTKKHKHCRVPSLTTIDASEPER